MIQNLNLKQLSFLFSVGCFWRKYWRLKPYVNYPGYDLIATNADKKVSSLISVKSRYRTDWDGFIIKNFDCDFVIFVTLNRGFTRSKKNGERGIKDPQYYVLPIEYVKKVRDPKNKWGKIVKHRLNGIDKYHERWDLIKQFLKMNI